MNKHLYKSLGSSFYKYPYISEIPINTLEGQKAVNLAEMADAALSENNLATALDFYILALLSGVPEPYNSEIKELLLDFLNK